MDPKLARGQNAADERRLEAVRREVRRQLKARARALPRHRFLISASMTVSGAVRSAVGVESFLRQTVDRSGEGPSLVPRLGVEAEPILNWLELRAGSYWEPTRFRGGSPRLHGTLGFDLRLVDWSVFGLFEDESSWRLTGAIDAARDYLAWGVTAGLWH